jgi:hypothetical protein
MENDKVKNISRLKFLKNTGIVAAGLTFLPDLLSAELKDSLLGRQLSGNEILDYQIIIPVGANASRKGSRSCFAEVFIEIISQCCSHFRRRKISQVKNGIYLVKYKLCRSPANQFRADT